MRIIFLVSLLSNILFSEEIFSVKGNMGIEYITYSNMKNDQFVVSKNEFNFKKNDTSFIANLDFFYSKNFKQKKDIYFNELYLTHSFGDYDFKFGKILVYWGTLEGYNVTDIFNQKNVVLDFFDKNEKKGSWSAFLSKYNDIGSIELGVKFYESNNLYVDAKSPYYLLPVTYDDNLDLSHSPFSPTIHLKYTFTSDYVLESDTSIIVQHGYDNKRYFKLETENSLRQYAYTVNKILLNSTAIYQDYIFKFEGAYTDIIDDKSISDYGQISLGVEKNFESIDNLDTTLYLEYYRYIYKDANKIENIDLSEIYDNDIFLAARVVSDDVSNTEIKLGLLHDMKKKETLYKLEGKSKISEALIIKLEVLHFSHTFESYKKLSNHTRAKFGLYYYF